MAYHERRHHRYRVDISDLCDCVGVSMTPAEIKTLRKRLGWTLAEFGLELGVTRACVWLWEHGRSTPKGVSMRRLGWLAKNPDSARQRPGLAGEEIRAIRIRLGLTQAALAQLVGVAPPAVCHWERGLKRPSVMNMRQIHALSEWPFDPVRREILCLILSWRRSAYDTYSEARRVRLADADALEAILKKGEKCT